MEISLIVAVSENNIIGKDNMMIWHMSADLRYFKDVTMGHHIIMGRKNYESIQRPLPGRTNIILTKQKDYKAEGCEVVYSLDDALKIAAANDEKEAMIIGGGEVYKLALPIADRIYLTRIHHEFDGDTSFPEIAHNEWIEKSKEPHFADEKNPFDYTFFVYERK